MRVPGLIIANEEELCDAGLEKPLEQVRNVASLPGIVGYSIAMPDIHWGYGFPIGGVAAMDAETGVISPGGVGYDINCGVRLALVPIRFRDMQERTKSALLEAIFRRVPSGTGKGSSGDRRLSESDYRSLVKQGARWSIEQGCGLAADLEHMESLGVLEEADMSAVSKAAQERACAQLGSIGSGNHFVEIGEVGQIFEGEIAKQWQLQLGQTYILIHTGSRGFGHQICQDFLNSFIKKGFAKDLADKQLVAAPLASEEGRSYRQAMAAAANFAFNNRQQILHQVRKAFTEVCGVDYASIPLLYDVCHNIAKMEIHPVEGIKRKLCVHRKGATRAYGPGAEELTPLFRKTGQPVLVPGDMGRASHVMVGCGNPLTWCSSCHGAGRVRSRVASLKAWQGKSAVDHMERLGVAVKANSYKTIAEEMPDAYKDVDKVVQAVQEASLAKKVAGLHPYLVIKG